MNSQDGIAAESVEIKQAFVNIKMMRVGNRQLTISVFKQLANGHHENFPTANIWGWVNHSVEGCPTWLVFEANGRLYRQRVQGGWEAFNYYTSRYEQLYIAV